MSSSIPPQPEKRPSERWWLKLINFLALFWMASYAIGIYFTLSSKLTLENIFGGPGAITPVHVSPVLQVFMNNLWAWTALFVASIAVVKEFFIVSLRTKLAINMLGAIVFTAFMVVLVNLVFV